MNETFIVGVPTSERDNLIDLAGQVEGASDLAEHRYFDGAEFVEVVLPLVLTPAAWSLLRSWIVSRAEVQKSIRVSVKGIELTGVKVKDAERMIANLLKHVTLTDSDTDVNDVDK